MEPALLSSQRHDWQTPDVVLHAVRDLAPIALDPCASIGNPCGATAFIHPPDNGLTADWWSLADGGLIYVNPPYGRALGGWVGKSVLVAAGGDNEILLLTPSRTDTAWYDMAESTANALCSWRGRLTFKGADAPAPFPSALFYWGRRPYLFCHVFQSHGRMRVLRERRAA